MIRRILAIATVATALTGTPASATKYCFHTGGFSACASATISVQNNLTQLTVQVQNLSGVVGNTTYSLFGLGLYYQGAHSPFSGSLGLLQGPTSQWINGVSSLLKVPGPQGGATWLGGAVIKNPLSGTPVNHPLNGKGYTGLTGCITHFIGTNTCNTPASFVFTLSNTQNFSLNNLEVAFGGTDWQDQNGHLIPKIDVFRCYATDPNCVTVPEPISMTLLATGLVGLGGAGLVRRRRKPSQK